MAKLLNGRGDLLQILREARNTIVDVEMDFDDVYSDEEVADMICHIRDRLSTVVVELDMNGYSEEDHREEWLM